MHEVLQTIHQQGDLAKNIEVYSIENNKIIGIPFHRTQTKWINHGAIIKFPCVFEMFLPNNILKLFSCFSCDGLDASRLANLVFFGTVSLFLDPTRY